MKNPFCFSIFSAILFCLLTGVLQLQASTFRLQVIHNMADPTAGTFDVQVNGISIKNNLAFRQATAVKETDMTATITIVPSNPQLALSQISFPPFFENKNITLVLTGVVDTKDFVNPDSKRSIAFEMYPNISSSEGFPGITAMFFHGVTDAPKMNILEEETSSTLFQNLDYKQASPAFMQAGVSTLKVVSATDTKTVLGRFKADLTAYDNKNIFVIASGFLDPAKNKNGKKFGLFGVLADGQVVEFPSLIADQPMAHLQLIHNAADPSLGMVDVYAGATKIADNISFRQATSFISMASGSSATITITDPLSTGPTNGILKILSLEKLAKDESYVAVLSGLMNTTGFAANPDGKPLELSLYTLAQARETAQDPGKAEFHFFHGVGDAPTVDFSLHSGNTLAGSLAYSTGSAYTSLTPDTYTLDIAPSGKQPIVSFTADMTGFTGKSATIFTSGFLDPAKNHNGSKFGLFAAMADGQVIEFPLLNPGKARVQIIHNVADPALGTVDMYAGDKKIADNLSFRQATPFFDIIAGTDIDITITGAGSTGPTNDVMSTLKIDKLNDKGSFSLLFCGLANPQKFATNPDGKDLHLTLYTMDEAREIAENPAQTELRFFHGTTDAPALDILEHDGTILADNLSYSNGSTYLGLSPAKHMMDITLANDNTKYVLSLQADLTKMTGKAALIYTSGFSDPKKNNNGETVGLYAALPDGTTLPLAIVPSTDVPEGRWESEINSFSLENESITLSYTLAQAGEVRLTLYDSIGRTIQTIEQEAQAPGTHRLTAPIGTLSSGLYLYKLQTGKSLTVRAFSVAR